MRDAISQDMIVSFRHKGLRRYYQSGKTSGIQPLHAKRLRMQLSALDTASSVEEVDIPGFRLHGLKGREKQRWSIVVNGNWRLTFESRDGNAYILAMRITTGWLGSKSIWIRWSPSNSMQRK